MDRSATDTSTTMGSGYATPEVSPMAVNGNISRGGAGSGSPGARSPHGLVLDACCRLSVARFFADLAAAFQPYDPGSVARTHPGA